MIIIWWSYNYLMKILQLSYDQLTIILWPSYNNLLVIISWHYNQIMITLRSSHDHLTITLKVPQNIMLLKSVYNNFCLTEQKWIFLYYRKDKTLEICLKIHYSKIWSVNHFSAALYEVVFELHRDDTFLFLKILQNNILNYCKLPWDVLFFYKTSIKKSCNHFECRCREVLLQRRAQYSWPPCTNWLR
jgi:hypothetical protein